MRRCPRQVALRDKYARIQNCSHTRRRHRHRSHRSRAESARSARRAATRASGSNVEHFPWSSDYYLKHGYYIPEGGLEKLKTFDAIFFGAVGAPDVPDHVSLWGCACRSARASTSTRTCGPARVLPGHHEPACATAQDIDWVIIRENSEGEYSGNGGRVHQGLPEEVATETSVFTRNGVARIHRFAFELARKRPRKHLTLVTKSNAQRHGMVMWDEIFYEVAKNYPDVETQRVLVDAMTTQMVLKPRWLDTVVATNLHADILSDLAAALSGSLGIAPTANLNPERKFPSMFEPDPRLGLRHHRQRHRQSDRDLLDRLDDARAPRRERAGRAAHESDRSRDGEAHPHARPRRRSDDGHRDRSRLRRALKIFDCHREQRLQRIHVHHVIDVEAVGGRGGDFGRREGKREVAGGREPPRESRDAADIAW